ncbi:hypothetical protein DCS_04848 [Drechmeria coniospora]|uniref:Uncharacterized protein n=1 Tax=Drechmeria coniospora TaxID=98403 RepID=A0A151GL49_DRECN|nr:hypothetical protein DCS_04848 [Drechmeria coniospora]KYK57835.1 hypothetical protein DCS_04848 [Drechmeria coniospora]
MQASAAAARAYVCVADSPLIYSLVLLLPSSSRPSTRPSRPFASEPATTPIVKRPSTIGRALVDPLVRSSTLHRLVVRPLEHPPPSPGGPSVIRGRGESRANQPEASTAHGRPMCHFVGRYSAHPPPLRGASVPITTADPSSSSSPPPPRPPTLP